MAKTMAEVLLRHWSRSTHTESEPFVDKCDGCGQVVHTWGESTDPNERLAVHQAAAMSAAGFGLVADAKAEALEEAVDDFSVNLTVMSGPRIRTWLSLKAAKYRNPS